MTTTTITLLTLKEVQRRRILWIGVLMGAAFLLLYGVGFHYVYIDVQGMRDASAPLSFLTLAGMMVTNFLIIMLAVLISVGAISGEVDSHTIDAIITKPVRRWEVVLGKWLGFALILLAMVAVLPGGVLLIVYLRSGFTLNNVLAGLSLMYLEGLIMMTISILGGTRLSTMANGAVAFMLYGLAFIGSWVEQIGALMRNETAVDIGIFSSLLVPTEILWKKASTLFLPNVLEGFDFAGPFGIASQPNDVMMTYAVVYMLVLLALALWSFSRRDL